MTHFQKAPKKPLLNSEQGEVFVRYLDDDLQKRVAKDIFVDGMTSEEAAEKHFYCKRQIERMRVCLTKNVLKKLIEKQIPKKVNISLKGTTGWNTKCHCPNCRSMISHGKYCSECGQALDWR